MDKLFEIGQILTRCGHKLNYHIDEHYTKASCYHIEDNDIVSIGINMSNMAYISFYINVKPSSVEIYRNQHYSFDHVYVDSKSVCGVKSFESLEGLLDELQKLGLINCGHNIKRAY